MAVFHDTADSKATIMKNKDVVRCEILGREGNLKRVAWSWGRWCVTPGEIIGGGGGKGLEKHRCKRMF